ncbi:hypothetical protein [Nocardia cyriacigeorgica]|uniref:hypothetical protein n=1 Tax=Nocardia cyriacigeorgica TaxID=135487 RepID=UPI0013D79977|nr:hypothetical protein [Nocardia cyriacigeorgica]NEW27248.1 hypothetical protein [Nocardia cyriacigeorgica]
MRLNHRNIEKLLKSDAFANLVNDAAIRVAAASVSDNVHVDRYTTDRGAAAVVVPAEEQARDGVLTRGAAAAGLEVKQKP